MSNRVVRAVIAASEDPNVALLDPNQDAQVINYGHVTEHLEGQQITFSTGSASLVAAEDDEATRDGFDEPIASSSEVLAASVPSDCRAPMKPRHRERREFDLEVPAGSINAMMAYIEECDRHNGRLDAEELAAVVSSEIAAAPAALPKTPPATPLRAYEEVSKCFAPLKRTNSNSESLLAKRGCEDASEGSCNKRSRSVEELEEENERLKNHVATMEARISHAFRVHREDLDAVNKRFKELFHEKKKLESLTYTVLFSVFDSFPAGEARANWLYENTEPLRMLAPLVRLDSELRELLDEHDVQGSDTESDSSDSEDA